MANDNISGVVLWTLLLRELQNRTTRLSYRFYLGPKPMGSIDYPFLRDDAMMIFHGL